MNSKVIGWSLVAMCATALAPSIVAQQARVSPHETHSSLVDGATITITYGRPSMRGRKIFGSLITYGRIWMPGADEATIIHTTNDLLFGDVVLPAGSYSFYTLTGETSWKFIINKQTGQFHTVYNEDQDFARLDPMIDQLPQPVEQLTIAAVPAAAGGGRLQLDWETTRLWGPFTVKK
jgi:hypothetical protein